MEIVHNIHLEIFFLVDHGETAWWFILTLDIWNLGNDFPEKGCWNYLAVVAGRVERGHGSACRWDGVRVPLSTYILDAQRHRRDPDHCTYRVCCFSPFFFLLPSLSSGWGRGPSVFDVSTCVPCKVFLTTVHFYPRRASLRVGGIHHPSETVWFLLVLCRSLPWMLTVQLQFS